MLVNFNAFKFKYFIFFKLLINYFVSFEEFESYYCYFFYLNNTLKIVNAIKKQILRIHDNYN